MQDAELQSSASGLFAFSRDPIPGNPLGLNRRNRKARACRAREQEINGFLFSVGQLRNESPSRVFYVFTYNKIRLN